MELNINDQSLFEYIESLELRELHVRSNPQTGLRAFIAIHNTERGPALGGCRCIEYDNEAQAIQDAARLAQGMTYKAAISQLPFGGGKTVLMKPKHIPNRQAYFESFGECVQSLEGRYLTAVDSGTTNEDMDYVGHRTRFVFNPSRQEWSLENPSIHTAVGVFYGVKAAVKFHFKHEDLSKIHVAIQGVGSVGYLLAQHLVQAGAKVTVSDKNQDAVARCVAELGVASVPSEETHRVQADVFAPCALGGILNDTIIAELQAPVVAGAANNQLGAPHHGTQLQQRGIVYAPDYVINSGGLIYVACIWHQHTFDLERRLKGIAGTLEEIFERSQQTHTPTNYIADVIARERIHPCPEGLV